MSDRAAHHTETTPPSEDAATWLATLLASYGTNAAIQWHGGPPRPAEIALRLKTIGFAEVVGAIDAARPVLSSHAEIRLYQEWIEANNGGNPHLFAAWFNLGVVYARENDPKRATVAYTKAREINPAFYPAGVNLGLSLEKLGHKDAALQTWTEALQSDEARTTLLNHKARLLENNGRLDEAEAILRTSLLTDPSQPDAAQHWLHIRQKTCRWPVFANDIPGLDTATLMQRSGPLALLALTDAIAVQRDAAAGWIDRKIPPAAKKLAPPGGYAHARLRIGYMSSDFCRHAMSYLITELFERHDRGRFEIYGYCATIEDGSDVRQRVLAAFDHRRMIRELTDEQAARLIRDDEIDILIDLNGLTAHTRLAVLRWRPAPIQVTYLGFVGPVPLPELDYMLCDDFVVPPGLADAYLPAPFAIEGSYQANDSKRAVGRALTRQEAGLPENRFVLCCFSNHYKITDAMFGAWMNILLRAEAAVLWLAVDNAWSQANLRDAANRAGVAPERIVFVPRAGPELYMSRLRLADLYVDTFPYNAGTVASDAVRMGLPLVTLCGEAFASRMAGSLLHAIGATEGITSTLEDYIAVAARLATDQQAYAGYKAHFSAGTWSATMGDIIGFTMRFEAALERMAANAGHTRPATAKPEHAALVLAARPDCSVVALIGAVDTLPDSERHIMGLEVYARWLDHHAEDPLRHAVYFNHGTLLSKAGRTADALAAFAEAVRLAPRFTMAAINAGLMLERLDRLDEAVSVWRQASDQPFSLGAGSVDFRTAALKHLARVFKQNANYPAAEDALRRCLEIDPQQRDAIQHWIAVREMQCKWPVIEAWGGLTQQQLMAGLSPLAAAIHTDDPLYQLANAQRSFERDTPRSPGLSVPAQWSPPAAGVRPLRIGYVSPDLREHAVGYLTAELFALHDRTRVEVFAYYSGRGGADALQARIRQSVDHWCSVGGWAEADTAARIMQDQIDILVDLGGHTGDAPQAAIALRPAPVIVNWLGYPGTMGTPHHHYIIADETVIPDSDELYFSETVVRLPCYQPTDRRRTVAQPPSRAQAGLPDDAMVYCCFNGTQKISPVMFARWMHVLSRVPASVLWLLSCDGATDQRLRAQAACHGIPPERLVFAPRLPNAEHLARYRLADVFLDTAPYGAHTTASDALWMGVPVITFPGRSFASRVCASLVLSAGLPDLVCDGPDHYCERAIDLGLRKDVRIALRARLRADRDRCTLFDMPDLVRRLETLYQGMWDDAVHARLPQPDLTNLPIYAEIGDSLDHSEDNGRSRAEYDQRYLRALEDRDRVTPLGADSRLWRKRP